MRSRALPFVVIAAVIGLAPGTFAQTPRLTATPVSMQDADRGTTTIHWDTADGSLGRVYVSTDGGDPSLFASGTRGTVVAPWITAGSTYEFRLIGGSTEQQLLATVTVIGEGPPEGPAAIAATPVVHLLGLALLLAAIWYARRALASSTDRVLIAGALVAGAGTVVAVLSVEPRPLTDQPFPDASEYADAARQLAAGNGYVTHVHDGQSKPPRYPPGFSIALAPFAVFGTFPANVQFGSRLYSALYVVAAFVVAWMLGGPLAAGLTALLIAVSPFAYASASLVMSDALAAAGTVMMVGLASRWSARRASMIGGLVGALIVTRLSLVVNLIAALLRGPARDRIRIALFASPILAALAWYQWATFGSPFRTGYSYWLPDLSPFGWEYAFSSQTANNDGPWIIPEALNGWLMQWTCPCPFGGPLVGVPAVVLYAATLLGVFWVYAPPLATVAGAIYLWKHRDEPSASLAIWIVVLSLVLFSFYFAAGVRFMAGPATILLVFSAVSVADWVHQRAAAVGQPHDRS